MQCWTKSSSCKRELCQRYSSGCDEPFFYINYSKNSENNTATNLTPKYIAHSSFGADINFDDFIDECLKNIVKSPNYIYTKQLLTELYETKYGIHNHQTDTNPLSSVAFYEAENYLSDYVYETYLNVYLYNEINKRLNMSFDEFLSRPKCEIEMILKVIQNFNKKTTPIKENLIKELQKSDSSVDKK